MSSDPTTTAPPHPITKQVLDHGFVRLIDTMGDDNAIVQMARVSYGEGTKTVSEDRGLIRYLKRHAHTSPFEGCEIIFHLKMPIFVARQWLRHRTAATNEYSGRYSIMKDEFYIPSTDQIRAQSSTNKQGSGDVLPYDQALEVQKLLLNDAMSTYGHYERMVGDPDKLYCNDEGDFVPGYGVARELARIVLPLNTYTEFYWKIDLHNLFHFLKLRSDPHAQYEIRVYAEAIEQIVKEWVPNAYEAWVDYVREAVTFSRMEMNILRKLFFCASTYDFLADEFQEEHGLSKREVREFIAKLHSQIHPGVQPDDQPDGA